MRTKTRASRARVSKIPPQPSTMAARLLHHLPSSSEAHPDTTVNEAEGDSICSVVLEISSDDDICPSSTGKTALLAKKCRNSVPVVSFEKLWKQKVTCIKCDKGGQLLVCSDSTCSLAVHNECINCLPGFDDMGHFYCPYCLYRQAAAESAQAREKAMLAKKALSNFMDEKIDGNQKKQKAMRAKKKDPDENSNQSAQAEEAAFAPDCRRSREPTKAAAEASLGNEQIDVLFCRRGDNAKLDDCDQPTTVPEQEMCPKTSVAHGNDNRRQEEATPANESFQASITKEKINNAKNSETHQFVVADVGETIQVEHSGQVDDHQHEEVVEDQQRAEENVDPARKSSSDLNTTAEENAGDRNKNVITSSGKRKLPEFSDWCNAPTFPNAMRKNIPWTAEEEDTLTEGVQKFSTTDKKNIPWRKILGFHRHIFDKSRNPADLKNKRRNILSKESTKINRRS